MILFPRYLDPLFLNPSDPCQLILANQRDFCILKMQFMMVAATASAVNCLEIFFENFAVRQLADCKRREGEIVSRDVAVGEYLQVTAEGWVLVDNVITL